MKEGYLDDVLDVLDAHCHPCIMMGRYAFLWMGLEVFAEQVSPLRHCQRLIIIFSASSASGTPHLGRANQCDYNRSTTYRTLD